MLFEKPWALFKVGDQPKMKLIHSVWLNECNVLWMLLLSICHSLKNHFVICENFGACDISFSLPANSHGNFHRKIAFDCIPLH